MLKFIRSTLLSISLLLAICVVLDIATYDARAWQADYQRLKRDMAQGYANLDWMVERRKLDLMALDRETTAAIDGAHSRIRAGLAIRRFISSFNDPHLKLQWSERAPANIRLAGSSATSAAKVAPESPRQDPPAGSDCAAAGYEEDDHRFAFPFSELAGWTPLQEGDFPTALLGDLGVLRIAQFGENRFAATCAQVFAPGLGARELQLKVRARLQGGLIAALRDLQSRGAQRLLVDVTGNGGGTEWASEVTALMTDRALTRAEARMPAPLCDRSAVWRGRLPCPVLAGNGARAELQGSGAWRGPVLILMDRGTGSASEDFVAWLQQNKVATVIGARSAGAGCGYINGGTRTHFRASRFDVLMPNCARFLDDGTNEIEGIAPDIAIPMDLDDAHQQAEALRIALGAGKRA